MYFLDYKNILKIILAHFIDAFNRFLLLVTLVLFLVSLFFKNFFVYFIPFLFFCFFLFRLFSKNKVQRTKENATYLKVKNRILHPFSKKRKSKDSIYKKCHACGTILKLPLPKRIGILHAKCPSCGNRVTLLSFKKQKKEKVKVEVIKKKS